jgi:hypothetical protein
LEIRGSQAPSPARPNQALSSAARKRLNENDAVAKQCVEERIPGVLEAYHVDLDLCGGTEVCREREHVKTSPQHGHVSVGARVSSAPCAGAEEESQADVLASTQRPAQGFDG